MSSSYIHAVAHHRQTLYDLAHNKIKVHEKTLETRLMEALKILYEPGAEHWDQNVDNLSFCDNGGCDDGKVMVVDLEDV
ncbi:uncharacterized protein N7518_007070 [Penicillium psychrosexuale]|uniref:uncharacterized protein n=1 Tax=Penicillium psychrosexuale TaxID=1002107 RepID=UPI002545351B|nr:uncharacterized protein N7518_007070 [Penicillium psychrosexuale]KAJ5790059.1 hypothetical protein N7518_007070 [Penicillium psychrosexuale]